MLWPPAFKFYRGIIIISSSSSVIVIIIQMLLVFTRVYLLVPLSGLIQQTTN